MCLIAFGADLHPKYRFILVGNRDEFFHRETAPLHFWADHPILGGRDLKAGGTWLGVTRSGRLATVTNFRDPQGIREEVKSRGTLPTAYLNANIDNDLFFQRVDLEAERYNGFNLLGYTEGDMYHYSNYEKQIHRLAPDELHGLSNALLDTPWPKVVRLKKELSQLLNKPDFTHSEALDILGDTDTASDRELPETGIPFSWEKALSAICIRTEDYGTCCSAVITIDQNGWLTFTERTYPVGKRLGHDTTIQFCLS